MEQGIEPVSEQPVCPDVCTDAPTETPKPKGKGGRPKGRKDTPAEYRIKRKLLKAMNKQPQSWWDSLVTDLPTKAVSLLGIVLPRMAPEKPPPADLSDLRVRYQDEDHDGKPRTVQLRFDNDDINERVAAHQSGFEPDKPTIEIHHVRQELPDDVQPRATPAGQVDPQTVAAPTAAEGNVEQIAPAPPRDIDVVDIIRAVQGKPGVAPTEQVRKTRELLIAAWESLGFNPRVRDRQQDERERQLRKREREVAEAELKLNQQRMLEDDDYGYDGGESRTGWRGFR